MKIGIIGYGTVGKAVEYGFNSPTNQFTIVDSSISGTTTEDVVNTDVVFVCLPTDAGGRLDLYTTTEVLNHLVYYKYKGLVVLKSAMPPGALDLPNFDSARTNLRLAFNPDSVGQVQPNRDFVEASMIIIGAETQPVIDSLKEVYEQSNVIKKWFMVMTTNEAILMKLFIDTFLATKAVVIGEFSDMLSKYSDRDWNDFAVMMTHDPRIGRSMTQINDQPGYDSTHYPAIMDAFARAATRLQTRSGTVAGAMVSNTLLKAK